MFNYIGPISYGGAYIPMVLSFGSGRKEAAWGAQLLYAGYAVTAYLFILLRDICPQAEWMDLRIY